MAEMDEGKNKITQRGGSEQNAMINTSVFRSQAYR